MSLLFGVQLTAILLFAMLLGGGICAFLDGVNWAICKCKRKR